MEPSHVLVIGPMPPPVNGQAAATFAIIEQLEEAGAAVDVVDTSVGASKVRPIQLSFKMLRTVRAILRVSTTRHPVYVSVHTGAGMWFTNAVVAAARLKKRRLVLHHHSYDYVRQRRLRGVALARIAGSDATHVVLGERMARDIVRTLPEMASTFTLNNSGLIDGDLLEISRPITRRVVLGHLSNLTAAKGVDEVVRLALELAAQNVSIQLVIAGPTEDETALESVRLAKKTLGSDFTYLGPVTGLSKFEFFKSITHFVFPTKYHNEAAPFVLLEALAAGVPCIATDRGCIAELIGTKGGLCVPADEDFVAYVTNSWSREFEQRHDQISKDAREQFGALRADYERQIDALIGIIRA